MALLVHGSDLLVTAADDAREIAHGWVAVDQGVVVALGGPEDAPPRARERVDARGCLVTPGLVNVHHHMFQNLTRAWPKLAAFELIDWAKAGLSSWMRLDAADSYLSAWVAAAELALSGCTTTSDMLYITTSDYDEMLSRSIVAIAEVGLRSHAVRAVVSRGQSDGGVHPDQLVQTCAQVVESCLAMIERHHDTSTTSMSRIALGPAMLSSIDEATTEALVVLAESEDLRLHTHLSESQLDEQLSQSLFACSELDRLERLGLLSHRTWVAHAVQSSASDVSRMAAAGVSVAHCPSSNCVLGSGVAPVAGMRRAGVRVGLGVDGSSSSDSSSLVAEARAALLVGKLRDGPGSVDGRSVLHMATRGGAACLGRTGEIGELSVGSVGDIALWPLDGIETAGSADPVEAWCRCAPRSPRDVFVGGTGIVRDGTLVAEGSAEIIRLHNEAAGRLRT